MKKLDKGHMISTVGKDDYPELEGKTLVVDTGENVYTGIVVGCNRSVGVTIVNANDKDDYLFCFRGPVSPGYIKGHEKEDAKAFKYCIEAITEGVFTNEGFYEAIGHEPFSGAPSSATCAYAQ